MTGRSAAEYGQDFRHWTPCQGNSLPGKPDSQHSLQLAWIMSQRLGWLSVMGQERAPPTLAQEDRQAGHLKEAGLLSSAPALPACPPFPAGLPQVSSCPLWLSGLSESSSNAKTGRGTESSSPVSPLYRCESRCWGWGWEVGSCPIVTGQAYSRFTLRHNNLRESITIKTSKTQVTSQQQLPFN